MMRLPEISSYTDRPSANTLSVDIGRLTVWFSYKTPVAFRFGGPVVVRRNEWGPTTGKHLNAIDGGDKAGRLDGETFAAQFAAALKKCGLGE